MTDSGCVGHGEIGRSWPGGDQTGRPSIGMGKIHGTHFVNTLSISNLADLQGREGSEKGENNASHALYNHTTRIQLQLIFLSSKNRPLAPKDAHITGALGVGH